jgi:hypothetical protein
MTKVHRKLRNLVAQSVVSCLKNAQKLIHASAISKIFPGVIPQTPVKMGRGVMGQEREREREKGTEIHVFRFAYWSLMDNVRR